ncbi:hypothetical protein S40285_10721 [Stachybotrys chlorohalonatus IBT 40285]|uniref:Uncharacterized protein n=1 Tax=Stachybotrys chlorohalonatus (strain IBT 40285) TaxID=1283841 RepID=A0A084QXQ6_STAC4|nr:hypothetical protein S40285_10721 [Stachybotrys chlorohalonata IBT 40285]
MSASFLMFLRLNSNPNLHPSAFLSFTLYPYESILNMDGNTELSSTPFSRIRSEIQQALSCSEFELDALVGGARPGTWNHLSRFLQDTRLDGDAARQLLERSKLRPGRRKLVYLTSKDIEWAAEEEAVFVPDSAASNRSSSPTKSEVEDAISSPSVVDPCWTTINFKPDTSPMPLGSKSGLNTLQHDSDLETKQGIKSSGSPKRKRDDTTLQTLSSGLGGAVLSSSTKRPRPAATESSKHKSTIAGRPYPSTTIAPINRGSEMEPRVQNSSPNSYLDASDAMSIQGRGKFGIPEESLALLEDDQAEVNDYIINHPIALLAAVATKPFAVIDAMTEDFQSVQFYSYSVVGSHVAGPD